ncbi:MAG: mechanosensitive ion channel family protein [bacterium]|nr:mechanosensitive ion channel family protein [bacterium]
MEELLDFLRLEFLGIRLWVYFASMLSILLGFIGKRVVAAIFKRLIKLSKNTRVRIDEIILTGVSKPLEWAMGLGGIFLALHILPIPSEPVDIAKFVKAIFLVSYTVLATWTALRLVDGLSVWWEEKAKKTETKLDDQLVPIAHRSARVFLYLIGAVFALQNLGYSVMSLLTGLGLGGAALALASKDTVANLFGSIVIFFDKPFQIGDWIEMGKLEGTVEDVGLRTTRVRTFANSLITVPNALFTTSPINNWSLMKKRRIKMNIGVSYSASPEKLNQLVSDIRQIILDDEKMKHDFFLVNFNNFGPSSLDIFIYCFTVSTVWAEFLQTKQEFMFKIMEAVYNLGLDFAFPTQTLHVESFPGYQNDPDEPGNQLPQ